MEMIGYKVTTSLNGTKCSICQLPLQRIRSCNEAVLVADARYAGRVKEAARQIPRLPAFTGKLACIHSTSNKTTLAMWLMLNLRTSSIRLKIALPRQGEQCNMKRTCDVLELAFKISNAS